MANILGIQILGSAFGIFMLYYTFLHWKRKELTRNEGTFWISFWGIFLIVTVVPSVLDGIVVSLDLTRTMDLFIITGFLFLVGALFYTYLLVRKNQKKLEEIVRNIALKK